jgi:hypothetical protein
MIRRATNWPTYAVQLKTGALKLNLNIIDLDGVIRHE